MTKSFFDIMYNHIVSIDNDCSLKEDEDYIYEYILRYIEPKLKQKNNISQFLKLSKETLLERDVLKEICITMLLDYEKNLNDSVFYKDIVDSKEYHSFKKYIYYPTLK